MVPEALSRQMGAWSVNCRDAVVSVKIQYSFRGRLVVLLALSNHSAK